MNNFTNYASGTPFSALPAFLQAHHTSSEKEVLKLVAINASTTRTAVHSTANIKLYFWLYKVIAKQPFPHHIKFNA